jgi:hypothetical protein
MQQINQLHKKIMRRIYYAYALRVSTQAFVIHAVLFIASVYALSKLVHVASILQNISNTKVGSLGTYFLNTIMHAEFLTMVVLAIVIFSALSIPISFRRAKFEHTQTA